MTLSSNLSKIGFKLRQRICLSLSYTQIFFVFAGWALLIYLSNRTLRRGEISRLKDRLVDSVSLLQEKLSDKVEKLAEPPNREELSQLEFIVSAKATQLEFKVGQINRYVGFQLIRIDHIVQLRETDLYDPEELPMVFDVLFDMIEHIESRYDGYFYNDRSFIKYLGHKKLELQGAVLALLVMTLYVVLFNLATK